MEVRASLASRERGSRAEVQDASSRPHPVRSRLCRCAASSLIRAASLMLACVTPLGSIAAPYSCIGKVDQVTVDPGGNVNASFIFTTGTMAWQSICSIDSSINSVTTASCKGILAVLMTARSSGQGVEMWFDNGSGGNCNAPPWQSIRTAGWYWGPSLRP